MGEVAPSLVSPHQGVHYINKTNRLAGGAATSLSVPGKDRVAGEVLTAYFTMTMMLAFTILWSLLSPVSRFLVLSILELWARLSNLY